MANSTIGRIRAVTPDNDKELDDFNYIQVGVSGTVRVQFYNGDVVDLSQAIIDRWYYRNWHLRLGLVYVWSSIAII